MKNDSAGADHRIVADFDRTKQDRVGSDVDVVTDDRRVRLLLFSCQ